MPSITASISFGITGLTGTDRPQARVRDGDGTERVAATRLDETGSGSAVYAAELSVEASWPMPLRIDYLDAAGVGLGSDHLSLSGGSGGGVEIIQREIEVNS